MKEPNEMVNRRWDQFIQETIAGLQAKPGEWVSLAEVRSALAWRGTREPAQERHLERMLQEGKIGLAANSGSLTVDERYWAITIDGEIRHLIRWIG
jgi:hypothetical protein